MDLDFAGKLQVSIDTVSLMYSPAIQLSFRDDLVSGIFEPYCKSQSQFSQFALYWSLILLNPFHIIGKVEIYKNKYKSAKL